MYFYALFGIPHRGGDWKGAYKMLDALKNAPRKVTGVKQVLRALKNGQVERVYVARDADEFLYRQVLAAAEQAGAPVVEVDEMKELGLSCQVEVKAAAAGILK